MELKLGQMGTYGSPIVGCFCLDCEKARAEQSKTKPVMSYAQYNTPFVGLGKVLDRDRFSIPYSAFDPITPGYKPLPFVAPAPEPEIEYTHVLLDFDGADPDGFELHTAESLIEAIADRRDDPARFTVFRLSDHILDAEGV